MTDDELITEAWRAAADDPDSTLSLCSSDRFAGAMGAALQKARAHERHALADLVLSSDLPRDQLADAIRRR